MITEEALHDPPVPPSGPQLVAPVTSGHAAPGAGATSPASRAGFVRGLDDYAHACLSVGQPVLQRAGTWWREVRPCFFRPVLPFLDPPAGPSGLPSRTAFFGCQFGARPTIDVPNSFLSYVAFLDAPDYDVQCLKHSLRNSIKLARKRFTVEPLPERGEVKSRAHGVYLEFFRRTRYRYLSDRVDKARFDRWVDAEYSAPGLVALGAWAGSELVAVSLSRIVGEAWVYSSFFSTAEALRGQVASLMLHHVRARAALSEGVTMVYAGMMKPGAGASVDAFYFHRGAVLVRRPAVLRLNPVARLLLARLRPDLWQVLRGESPALGSGGSTLESP